MFKKRKEKEIEDPLSICKRIFKAGVSFNNGNLLNKKQNTLFIESIRSFEKRSDNDISMKFDLSDKNGPFTFTVYKDGKFADIIE